MSNQEFDLSYMHGRRASTEKLVSRFLKRTFDLGFSILLIPIAAPLIFGCWVMARSEGQSGFFGHTRIGRDGVPFKCWKIRTMISDAEDLLQSHLNADPELAQEWASTFKLKNDPRITKRGAFLRQSGLDELPQLWNVLRGEMSIVGPRPVPRDELVKKYAQHSGVYKKMRPGITGIWQVSGRGNCSYPERVRMDAHYAENASLTLDVSIVLRTIGAVLRKTGS